MGRNKTPDALKKLRGTTRKDRNADIGDESAIIAVSLAQVIVPKHLTAEAKKIYKECVQQLFSLGMLSPIDAPALELYANAIATARKMQQTLDKEGYLVLEKDEDGVLCKVSANPAQKILKDAVATANTIGAQFGWSPAARLKMRTPTKEDKKNEFDEYNE